MAKVETIKALPIILGRVLEVSLTQAIAAPPPLNTFNLG